MGGNCSTISVQQGDSCTSLAARCGITGAEFTQYNPSTTLCSSLKAGQKVCCSSGSLPVPQPYANGTCYTYQVLPYDTCDQLAAANSITTDDIEAYNNHTWGWFGCGDLKQKQYICLSSGNPPFPVPLQNAVCGPQVPGTVEPTNGTSSSWAFLNQCPLNACCDIWGECGTTAEFCTASNSTTGAPGTAAPLSNGCISNCGTAIANNQNPPAEYASIGYFEAFNLQRSCLRMFSYQINESIYTHIHYAFGNITTDYQINDGGYTQQFQYFSTQLKQVKRIMSFGGWDFSTNPNTYMIFREGVTAANRQTLAQNMAAFITSNGLDGVDIDWEYPGAPDIPGIPPASTNDGANYLLFLQELRSLLPSKSISISAPASYWYLRGFPIADMANVVDYIVFMTYDLHGTWDLRSNSSQDGCSAGNCLRSDVNITETMDSLAMITKAGVPTSKIIVGVTSYGRSFQMSEVGCTGPECTWSGPGEAGICTQTPGYIGNAEIANIIATNPTAQQLSDFPSNSDILVYNSTQWVGYLGDAKKQFRTAAYKDINMGGVVDWAIDLQQFYKAPPTSRLGDNGGDDYIDINSIFFYWINNPVCTSSQKKKFEQGWRDAVYIASEVSKNVNFAPTTGWAELDFFGPTEYNTGYQSYIEAVLHNAGTFIIDSVFHPALWEVEVSCMDWKNRCDEGGGTKAYVNNIKYGRDVTDDPSSTMTITLCPIFFDYNDLSTVINEGKQSTDWTKLDMRYYRTKGHIILHEMMHADVVAYTANGNRHISDLQQLMRPIGSDEQYIWTKIYDFGLTKAMARTQDQRNLGKWVTTNADTFACYASAKIVTSKIGRYPYLPVVTNETIGLATNSWAYFVEDTDGTLYVNTSAIMAWGDTPDDAPVFSSSSLTCSADSDDEECGDTMQVVNTTQWTDDSVYPSDYIAQYNSWIAAITANGGPPAYEPKTLVDPDPDDVSLQCYSDIPSAEYTGTVEVNSALAAIGSQCALWQEQSAYLNWTDYRNTEAMVSNSTGGTLWLGGFWNMGDPSCTDGLRTMENAECIYMMTAILNLCDVGSTNKQGGYMINNCIVWAMAVYE